MPIDRGSIDAQLREIGEGERWWERREFRDLPHILHADERITGIVEGTLLGARRPRLGATLPWLIIATTQRIICLKDERFARKQIDVPASEILRIRQGSRLGKAQLTIETSHRRYRIRIRKAEAFRFVGALAPLVPKPPARTLPDDLSALSWLPGIETVATLPGFSGIVSRVSMLSPPDPAPREYLERLEATVERLQSDVERLDQQVQFLENLLQTRAEQALEAHSRVDS